LKTLRTGIDSPIDRLRDYASGSRRVTDRHRSNAFITCQEGKMSEPEMKDDVESDEFTDELSDEALDRSDDGVAKLSCLWACNCGPIGYAPH
jgi:hypothetical protein